MKSPMMLFDPDPVAAAILATQLRHAGFPTYVTPDGAAAILSAGRKQLAMIVVIADLADSQMRHCLEGHQVVLVQVNHRILVLMGSPDEQSHRARPELLEPKESF
jgi:CheY-like chemotaxis protein